MKILALDSSAIAASCAVVENGKILVCGSVNVGLTHSQTLMPLVENTLKSAEIPLSDIDAFAVTVGPGSFTGLRIAISAVKGMAFACDKPVCGVSTLLSLAYNLMGRDIIACPVMDARRGEVYNALFDVSGSTITRLTEDRAISLDELGLELSQFTEKEIVLVGDGADLACNELFFGNKSVIAPEIVRWQNAVSVCLAAADLGEGGEPFATAKELMPRYIRKPQAERELIVNSE